jgi:hypothetical protein
MVDSATATASPERPVIWSDDMGLGPPARLRAVSGAGSTGSCAHLKTLPRAPTHRYRCSGRHALGMVGPSSGLLNHARLRAPRGFGVARSRDVVRERVRRHPVS